MERFETQLRATEPAFRELIGRIPLHTAPSLPPAWLRCEMLERHAILRHAPNLAGKRVLEVGSGPHALATVPLAFGGGRSGRVIAVERSRWSQFRPVTTASGLAHRIWPVAGDARRLPFRADSADLAVCVHGIRSLGGRADVVRVLREMLRVSPRIFLAESLPIARTKGARAHLAMYDLRKDVFRATTGLRDDLRYLPLEQLASLAERAGGRVEQRATLEVDLPHFLARFPRTMVEAIPPGNVRERLLLRWDVAERMLREYGEDHPPVGIVTARRP
jgi:SAM-dependent methyltransferase